MADKVHGTFVHEKVSKIRWKPESNEASIYFVTGSWDNEESCRLAAWHYPPGEEDVDNYPTTMCSHLEPGDITEIKFLNSNNLAVSTSLGTVLLLKLLDIGSSANMEFQELCRWDKLHSFGNNEPSPCTGITHFHEDIVTVGEDGRIALLNTHQRKPVHVIKEADSCSIRCVCFLRHHEILTGNLRGHMKVWDLRAAKERPTSTFMLSGDQQYEASCVTHHPTQQHTVLAGGEDGSLTVWDLRQSTFPVTLLSAHSSMVSEMLFHSDRPEHLFTCSSSGEIWHWDTSAVTKGRPTNGSLPGTEFSVDDNPWLSSDAVKHRLEVFSLMPQLHKPINSLDVNKGRAVLGCDNEAVYVIKDVIL